MNNIETRILGRTGLPVSVLGLGGGGNSRLGLSNGKSLSHAAEVVRAALDLGITLFDTARGYGTERAVGEGIQGRLREQVVVSSKSPCLDKQGQLLSTQAFADNIDTSLRETGLETIDVYYIHALRLEHYAAASERFVPVLEAARQAGKIRFYGVTEAFESDTRHDMLQRAVQDDAWDVMMVGFNLLNQSARERVLAVTRQKGIGTMCMFAVRRGLIDESLLRVVLERLAAGGVLDAALAQAPNLMETLGLAGVSQSFSEAAYRFAAYEPGMDCVLSGTSRAAHLEQNLHSVQQGPLPPAALDRLAELFGHVDSISGQVR
jgi:aryl-alcohol dehydrogenase-like predicted oxidoreductase